MGAASAPGNSTKEKKDSTEKRPRAWAKIHVQRTSGRWLQKDEDPPTLLLWQNTYTSKPSKQ